MAGHFLDQVFSYEGVHNALEMAEQVSLNREVMEIDAAAISTIKIGTLDTPARSAVLCWKVILEKSLPKEILGARQIDNARRLAQEIESLEHQAKISETPIGALFAMDREEKRRRRTTALTASAFVMGHILQKTFPRGGTAEVMKTRMRRLVKDRNIARNVDATVEVFNIGVISIMRGSSW
jgi:hypothetical protein